MKLEGVANKRSRDSIVRKQQQIMQAWRGISVRKQMVVVKGNFLTDSSKRRFICHVWKLWNQKVFEDASSLHLRSKELAKVVDRNRKVQLMMCMSGRQDLT